MNNISTKTKSIGFYLTVIFAFIFLFDFLIKFSFYNDALTYRRYSAVLKILLEIFFIGSLIKIGIGKNLIVIVSLLILCFITGQIFLFEKSVFCKDIINEVLRGDIYHLNKYIFIILFVFYTESSKHKILLANTFIRVLIYFLIVNACFIIIGFLFQVNFFQSFPNSSRFGYSGLFSKSGEAVLLYIMIAILFYIRFLKNKNFYPVLFFIIIAMLTGKKIALLLPLLLFVDFFVLKFKNHLKIIFITVFCLIIFYFESIALYAIDVFPFWKPLYHEKGLWSVVFSTRNLNFFNGLEFIQNSWSFPNYLFGGVNYNTLSIEIDPFDLVLFFGIFGSIIYFYFIKVYYFNKIIKHRILLLGFFFLAMLYGAFLFNTLLMPSFFLFLIYLRNFYNEKNKTH